MVPARRLTRKKVSLRASPSSRLVPRDDADAQVDESPIGVGAEQFRGR